MSTRRRIVDVPQVRPLQDSALLTEIVRALVDRPEDVAVSQREDQAHRTLTLSVDVHRADRGRIIGKKGRTISAIRNLFSAIGLMDGRRVIVDLRED